MFLMIVGAFVVFMGLVWAANIIMYSLSPQAKIDARIREIGDN